MTLIVLTRHGETEWNRVERYRGRADVPLNATGLAQAELTAKRLASEWKPSSVYSSPLSRAVRTAEAIARHCNLGVQVESGIVDIDYGRWQGLTPEEARERWPEVYSAWSNSPQEAQLPDGERLDDLRARAMQSVRDLVARHASETIVLVSHTIVNRIILLSVLGLDNNHLWRLKQDTCAINVFEADGKKYTLVSLNDTCHLRSGVTG
jgi:probable phosphoglycerate mutase